MSNTGTGQIVRPVETIKSYSEIARTLRISEGKVRNLIPEGAPIILDDGRPKAEKAELWAWYKDYVQRQNEKAVK